LFKENLFEKKVFLNVPFQKWYMRGQEDQATEAWNAEEVPDEVRRLAGPPIPPKAELILNDTKIRRRG